MIELRRTVGGDSTQVTTNATEIKMAQRLIRVAWLIGWASYLAVWLGTPAVSQTLDCTDQQTQAQMNACAAQDWREADAALNSTYRKVRAMVRTRDRELGDGTQSAEQSLIKGQRGWIAFRDGHCDVVASAARGGSMERLLFAACAADVTRKRIRDFEQILQSPN